MSTFVFEKPDNLQGALTSLLTTLAGMIDLPQIFVLIKVVDEPCEQILSWRFLEAYRSTLLTSILPGDKVG